jgi:hypothetical protein
LKSLAGVAGLEPATPGFGERYLRSYPVCSNPEKSLFIRRFSLRSSNESLLEISNPS